MPGCPARAPGSTLLPHPWSHVPRAASCRQAPPEPRATSLTRSPTSTGQVPKLLHPKPPNAAALPASSPRASPRRSGAGPSPEGAQAARPDSVYSAVKQSPPRPARLSVRPSVRAAFGERRFPAPGGSPGETRSWRDWSRDRCGLPGTRLQRCRRSPSRAPGRGGESQAASARRGRPGPDTAAEQRPAPASPLDPIPGRAPRGSAPPPPPPHLPRPPARPAPGTGGVRPGSGRRAPQAGGLQAPPRPRLRG